MAFDESKLLHSDTEDKSDTEDSAETDDSATTRTDTLLAGLAQDAYAWAAALDSARMQLPAADRVPVAAGSPDDVRISSATTEDAHMLDAATFDVIDEMLSCAESDVMLLYPGGNTEWHWPDGLASQMNAAAERGCRVRVLLGRPLRAAALGGAEHVDVPGSEVRVGDTPDQAMLTVDQATTLLPAEGDTPPAAAVTQPDVVRLLSGFANLAWVGSEPLPRRAPIDCLGPRPAAEGVNRQLHRRILQLLAGGAKDETIARMLGMSVRTCRRHIAEIMAKLDAVSRFQAGANAVRFGLPGADVGALQHP